MSFPAAEEKGKEAHVSESIGGERTAVSSPVPNTSTTSEPTFPSKGLWLSCGLLVSLAALNWVSDRYGVIGDAVLSASAVVSSFVVAFATLAPFAARALSSLKRGEVTTELCSILSLVALAGVSIFGLVSTDPVFRSPSFYNALPVLCVLVAIALEAHRALGRAVATRIGYMLSEIAPNARLLKRGSALAHLQVVDRAELDKEEILVPSAQIRPDDLVRLVAGDYIPCDGVIVDGACEVDERRYTWRSALRFRAKGQEVFAGSFVRSGEVVIRSSAAQEDATISMFTDLLLDLLRAPEAAARREQGQRQIVNLSLVFLSACAILFWLDSGADVVTVVWAALAVLCVSICYRAMAFQPYLKGLALTLAFENGIVAKSIGMLEKLRTIRTVVFDYSNSPLSHGIKFRSFELVDARIDRDCLLSSLLAIFGQSTKELHQAASQFVRPLVAAPKFFKIAEYYEYDGLGIAAVLNGADFSVGTEEFLVQRGVHFDTPLVKAASSDENAIYVAVGEDIVARLLWGTDVQEESRALIEGLHAAGLRTYLFGECPQEKLDEAGKQLGIELAYVKGGLERKDYPDRIRDLGAVAIYAAGRLEKPILAACDASISIFDELTFDMSRSDVTLFDKSPDLLAAAFDLSRRLRAVEIQNSAFVLAGSMALLVLGSLGLLHPAFVALIATSIAATVGWNCLRFTRTLRTARAVGA